MLKTKVVILNWNGAEFLSRFLPKVRASVPEEVCVVVADNGSTDTSEEVVRGVGGVEWLPLGENYGFAEGYNRALKGMAGDVFVLLNSDVEPAEGWLEPLVARLEEAADVAALQPKILSEANRKMFEYAGAAGGFIDRYGYPFCRGRIMNTTEEDRGQYDKSAEVFWASGACMAIRADAWRKSGGLDGDFFAHMEEIDLCWRLQLMGYKIEVCPRSVVYHVGGGTLPKTSPRKMYLNFRNSLAMMRKCLPEEEMWRLRRRCVMDVLSWAVYVLSGKWSFARAVRRAHRDYHKMRPSLLAKREVIWGQRVVNPSPKTIYSRWIVWQNFTGCWRYSDLP